jgi:hypothetical protein
MLAKELKNARQHINELKEKKPMMFPEYQLYKQAQRELFEAYDRFEAARIRWEKL